MKLIREIELVLAADEYRGHVGEDLSELDSA
jgi:hypothetical protein